jgi:hypothetical protein
VTHQLFDNVTLVRSTHQLKFGGEFRFTGFTDKNDSRRGGQVMFNDRATGNGLASLLLGWTTSGSLVSTDVMDTRTDYYALFVQDDWKVTPRLTLNLGLRWEMDTPRWSSLNRQSGFDFTAVNPVSGTPGVVTFPENSRSKYPHDFDTNNFGPRIGFAFRLRDDLVLRGGYGLSYNGEYEGGVSTVLSAGYGINGSFASSDGGFTPPFLLRDGLPSVTREEQNASFGAVRVGQSPRFAPEFFQKNHVNGYMQQWNFTVQKQFTGSMVAEAGYLGNVGHKLAGARVDINMIPLIDGKGPATQSQALRPFPQFNNVSHLTPPWGNSSYHAMNLKLEKRYSNGMNLLANYTWSKFLDDVQGSTELAAGGTAYTHIALRGLDKSYSGNDIRHRVVASGVYELPFGKGRKWVIANPVLEKLAGGWGTGVIAEFRTGAPFGVIEQTNRSNAFSASQRPILLRNPNLEGGRSRNEMLTQYFDTEAFAQPAVGTFGNAARNVGFGPGYIGLDLSLHKNWTISDRINLQSRADFINLPNRPAFANPATLRGRGDFGQIRGILGSSTAREIQFGLRLEF